MNLHEIATNANANKKNLEELRNKLEQQNIDDNVIIKVIRCHQIIDSDTLVPLAKTGSFEHTIWWHLLDMDSLSIYKQVRDIYGEYKGTRIIIKILNEDYQEVNNPQEDVDYLHVTINWK
nr:putative serine/threonine protein kinase [Megavirus caiporensis]